MELNVQPNASSPVAMGDFMDPQKIVGYFGVTEGMKVADFGSGAGHFTILLSKLVGENGIVAAVDVMESALDGLRAKAKAEGLKNIETTRGNLEVLGGSGLANDSQDMVLIANSLFQNQNKQAMIQEARRVLKQVGTMIIIEWKKNSGGFGPPDNLRIDEDQMKQLAMDNGFALASSINAGTFHYGLSFKKS